MEAVRGGHLHIVKYLVEQRAISVNVARSVSYKVTFQCGMHLIVVNLVGVTIACGDLEQPIRYRTIFD